MIHLTYKESDNKMKLFLLVGLSLYKAKGLAQVLLVFFTALATIPFLETLEKFIIPKTFDNWVVFLILLILDIASGIIKHSKIGYDESNTLDKDKFFFKLFIKVAAGSIWLILINVILNVEHSSEYFNTFGISVLISWIGWSIASNIYVFTGSEFPPKWVMEYFKKRNEKGLND